MAPRRMERPMPDVGRCCVGWLDDGLSACKFWAWGDMGWAMIAMEWRFGGFNFQPCYFMSIIVLCFVVCFVHVVISLQIWQSSSNQSLSLCVLTRWQGRINTSGAWVGTSVKMYNPVLEQILTLCQTLFLAFNEGWFGPNTSGCYAAYCSVQILNLLENMTSVGVEEDYLQLLTPRTSNPFRRLSIRLLSGDLVMRLTVSGIELKWCDWIRLEMLNTHASWIRGKYVYLEDNIHWLSQMSGLAGIGSRPYMPGSQLYATYHFSPEPQWCVGLVWLCH